MEKLQNDTYFDVKQSDIGTIIKKKYVHVKEFK